MEERLCDVIVLIAVKAWWLLLQEQSSQNISREQVVDKQPPITMGNGYNKATTQTKHGKFISGVGKMTIIVFTIVFVGILALSSLLYIIFSAMSN